MVTFRVANALTCSQFEIVPHHGRASILLTAFQIKLTIEHSPEDVRPHGNVRHAKPGLVSLCGFSGRSMRQRLLTVFLFAAAWCLWEPWPIDHWITQVVWTGVLAYLFFCLTSLFTNRASDGGLQAMGEPLGGPLDRHPDAHPVYHVSRNAYSASRLSQPAPGLGAGLIPIRISHSGFVARLPGLICSSASRRPRSLTGGSFPSRFAVACRPAEHPRRISGLPGVVVIGFRRVDATSRLGPVHSALAGPADDRRVSADRTEVHRTSGDEQF